MCAWCEFKRIEKKTWNRLIQFLQRSIVWIDQLVFASESVVLRSVNDFAPKKSSNSVS